MNTNCDIERILAGLNEHGFEEGDIVRLFGHKDDEDKALLIAENAKLSAQFFEDKQLKKGQVIIIKGEDPIGKIDNDLLEKELQNKAVARLPSLEEQVDYLRKPLDDVSLSGQERRRQRRKLERQNKNR